MSANKEREALAALVEVLRERHYGRMPEEVQRAYDNAKAVLALPSTSTDGAQAGWIKPAKGMPPPWVTVLVDTSCGHVTTGMHAPGIGWNWEPADDEDEDAVIAHWQPLPKPAPRSTHENE